MADSTTYQLYYWPALQGRGEMVRLALEEAGVGYDDVARRSAEEGGGIPAMLRLLKGEALPTGDGAEGLLPLAPPVLVVGGIVVAQTAAILDFLGPRLGLVPDDARVRTRALQLQLTLGDLADEAHDVHHPVSTSLFYADQRVEALRASKAFREQRLPKFLGYLESVLDRGQAEGLAGPFTYVDLSALWVIRGLRYAFPRALAALEPRFPRLVQLHDRVAARPRVAAYLGSPRCVPFDENGVFRHYAELDG